MKSQWLEATNMHKASRHIRVTQLLSESIDNLNLSKRRSILALLGIIVGSSSIIALLTIGGNAADEAIRIFKNMGTDILVVGFPYSHQNRSPLPLTLDSQALRENVPGISHIAPISLHSAELSHKGQTTDASLVGTTHGLADAIGFQLNAGRTLSRYDQRETFAVVGARVAEDLGSLGNPLRVGDLIRIDHYLFNVIGIAENLPATPLIPIVLDESILIPIEGMKRLHPAPEITGIIIKADETDLPALAELLNSYLTKIFNGREVDVQIPQQLLDGLRHQASTFSYLLAALGGISLLVGGVGVMNVMLMSVAERKREIGIRMALGARQRDIRTLFLLEAVNLSIVGAIVGALLGVAIAFSFTHFSGWEFTLSITALPLGVGCSLLTGIFFGLYPAISASKLQPAEALRAE